MKQKSCPQEAAVARAVRAGQWEEALRAHAAGCTYCREVAQAAGWMQSLARSPEEEAALPGAGLVWWKAQLAQKLEEAERAQKPLRVMTAVAEAVAALGVTGLAAWNWPLVQGLLIGLLASLSPELWTALEPAVFAWVALPLVVVILSVIAMVIAYPVLGEE